MVLDRCTDHSEQLIRAYNGAAKLVMMLTTSWFNKAAEAKTYGCSHAKNKYIMMCDADMILDVDAVPKAVKILETKNDVDIVCFTYKCYSLFANVLFRIKDEWVNLCGKIIRKLGVHPTRTGIYLMKNDSAVIPDCESEYDFMQQKHGTVVIETKSLHLRPGFSKEKQLESGRSRAVLPQYNLLKVLVPAFLQFQPYLLVGYLHARNHRVAN